MCPPPLLTMCPPPLLPSPPLLRHPPLLQSPPLLVRCCCALLCHAHAPLPPPGNEAKAAALAEEFPSFDAALISSLLEDQGGDELEVRYYLKVSVCVGE